MNDRQATIPPAEDAPQRVEALEPVAPDQANEYLAGALRTSFTLLSAIMLALLTAYVFSGTVTIPSTERAVVLRFGRLMGATPAARGRVLDDGLHFTWPYPVDEVVRVPITKRTLNIDSFWHFEAPGDAGKPEHEKRFESAGLRPRYDGALITGDQGLVHVSWVCEYQVPDDETAVLDYVTNVVNDQKAEQLLIAAIEDASIRAAAVHSAGDISRTHLGFRAAVQRTAQATLDELNTGLQITMLTGTHTPPLQALAAFRNVTRANQMRDQAIETARQEATIATQSVAGENWPRIVEAIKAYETAEANSPAERQRLAALMDLLTDPTTTGEAKKLIMEAETYASDVVSRAEQAYQEFSRLLAAYRANPEMTVSRMWIDTLEEVFSGEMNIRLHVPPETPYVLYPQLDPRILRDIERTRTEKVRDEIRSR